MSQARTAAMLELFIVPHCNVRLKLWIVLLQHVHTNFREYLLIDTRVLGEGRRAGTWSNTRAMGKMVPLTYVFLETKI